jgi:hypothetical protein
MMAQKAKHESEEVQEIQPPDFDRAMRIITNDIRTAEEKNASSRGDLSAAWKAIEDECHVNKKAAKLFAKLRGMSDESRDDFLRSLYGLMKAGNVGISRDLVDEMEGGDAPDMPTREPGQRKLELVED